MRYFLAANLILFLTLNRFYSKLISIGPFYTAEIFITITILGRFKSFIRVFFADKFYAVFFLYFFGLLIYDLIIVGYDENTLRRFAVFIYFLIPFIFYLYLDVIRDFRKMLMIVIPSLALLAAIVAPEGFQSTTLAEVLGVLLLISFMDARYKQMRLFIALVFLIAVSGYFVGASVYRTPIIVLFSMIVLFFLLSKKSKTSWPNVFILVFMAVPLLIFSGVLGNLIIGIGGLLGADSLISLGVLIGGDIDTTRGSASGTTETRLLFWISIIENSTNNIWVFLFGSGFHYGFLEVTMPRFEFTDKALIEPHNAFMGFFFKSGIIGLILVIVFISKVYLLLQEHVGFTRIFPFLIGGLLYISMEVSLENPHGSILFWFYLFSTMIFLDTLKEGELHNEDSNCS